MMTKFPFLCELNLRLRTSLHYDAEQLLGVHTADLCVGPTL